MPQMVITRFAPSPTGKLHLGHAYAAKVAHDFAREHHGKFLMRFEDIDITRVREHFYEEIENDLIWLGLKWDEAPVRQTERSAVYAAALNQLKKLGVVYPCYCTRREIQHEIAHITNAPHGPEGSLYPGSCRDLTDGQRHEFEAKGRIPSWRLNANKAAKLTGPLTFTDLNHGKIDVDHQLLGDVILSRKDIGTSYHIAVVMDDAWQEITHVTRGDDLLHSTHIHRLLQALLELPEPIYLHHQLICDDEGKRLAKRHDALALSSLRETGTNAQECLEILERAPRVSSLDRSL